MIRHGFTKLPRPGFRESAAWRIRPVTTLIPGEFVVGQSTLHRGTGDRHNWKRSGFLYHDILIVTVEGEGYGNEIGPANEGKATTQHSYKFG